MPLGVPPTAGTAEGIVGVMRRVRVSRRSWLELQNQQLSVKSGIAEGMRCERLVGEAETRSGQRKSKDSVDPKKSPG